MKRTIKAGIAFYLFIGIAGIALIIGIAGTVFSGSAIANDDVCKKAPDNVPASLQVPSNECIKESTTGIGVQIYTCTAGAWVLTAPEANLTKNTRYVGNHFLGPNWQWKDGSKIFGNRVASAPSPDPTNNIAWLLLETTREEGPGTLADVKHIQRLATVGGVAPAGACTEGAGVRINYTANYVFYHLRN